MTPVFALSVAAVVDVVVDVGGDGVVLDVVAVESLAGGTLPALRCVSIDSVALIVVVCR